MSGRSDHPLSCAGYLVNLPHGTAPRIVFNMGPTHLCFHGMLQLIRPDQTRGKVRGVYRVREFYRCIGLCPCVCVCESREEMYMVPEGSGNAGVWYRCLLGGIKSGISERLALIWEFNTSYYNYGTCEDTGPYSQFFREM